MKRTMLFILVLGMFLSLPAYAETAEGEKPAAAEDLGGIVGNAEVLPADEAKTEAAATETAEAPKEEVKEVEPVAKEEVKEEAPVVEEAKEEAPKVIEAPKAAPAKTSENFLTSLGNVFKLYGFLRLDIAYDTSRTNYGNWALFVLPNKTFTRSSIQADGSVSQAPAGKSQSDELSINPRLSRFGIKMMGQEIELLKAKVGGKVEIDFYGGDVAKKDWASVPRWRLAYMSLDWGFMELRAGQDADMLSPLYPRIDYNGGTWTIGNVGARRPQLELRFKPEIYEGGRIHAQIGIARSGSVSNYDLDMNDADKNGSIEAGEIKGDGNNDGEDSSIPMIQYRLAFESKLWTKKAFTLGVSGHWQRYTFSQKLWKGTKYETTSMNLNGYSVGADLVLPILDWWVVRGEFFYGSNMADIFGGIFQGVNKEALLNGKAEGVKGLGFWVDTTIQPWKIWALTLGYTCDRPDADTLPETNVALIEATRYRNQAFYVNNQFDFGAGFGIGLQYLLMMTDYKYAVEVADNGLAAKTNLYSAVNHRTHLYLMYKF